MRESESIDDILKRAVERTEGRLMIAHLYACMCRILLTADDGVLRVQCY